MLKSDFKYNGSSQVSKEFVDTVNTIAKLINGMSVDLGPNGGTDVAKIEQNESGLKIDMTKLYIPRYLEYTE